METTEEIKQQIIEFCKNHNFEYESSKDLLGVYLDNLIGAASVEQMQRVHDKMGINKK